MQAFELINWMVIDILRELIKKPAMSEFTRAPRVPYKPGAKLDVTKNLCNSKIFLYLC